MYLVTDIIQTSVDIDLYVNDQCLVRLLFANGQRAHFRNLTRHGFICIANIPPDPFDPLIPTASPVSKTKN